MKLVGRHLNEMITDFDLELAQLHHQVEVWVTTDDYPPMIEIDCRLFTHKKPFKFVDLVKILPEGMWLHRKYDSLLYQSIVTLGENYNLLLASNNFPVVDPEDPEGEKLNIPQEELLAAGKSTNPALRAELLREFPSIDLYDPNSYRQMSKEIFATLLGEKEAEREIELEASSQNKGFESEAYEMNPLDENEEGEENMFGDTRKLINEEKIGDILNDLKKRKVAPKGAIVPLSAASSKKLMANKFETNSVAKFKKAQAKGASGGAAKKDGKKK